MAIAAAHPERIVLCLADDAALARVVCPKGIEQPTIDEQRCQGRLVGHNLQ